MATERTSKIIEGEMEALKEKIRRLEEKKTALEKVIEGSKKTRRARAFKAFADDDSKAAATLATARESEIRAAMEMQDIESAISEGRSMFAEREREWKEVLVCEAWAALMVEADAAIKEAGQIDEHAEALAALMAAHGRRIASLKAGANNLGLERGFESCGLRHADRIFAWKMIQLGFSDGFEKPSEQYRQAAGYAAIFKEQIDAARARYDAWQKSRREAAAAETPSENAEA